MKEQQKKEQKVVKVLIELENGKQIDIANLPVIEYEQFLNRMAYLRQFYFTQKLMRMN